ncbi:MAG: hypothetical protein UT91_C0036G0006 [Parcubacteria group bacterium GW2011_GWA2_40_23]|nr:MAG: hypothetical protein UT91_C0036G0006 [Parcubacteria group bacterium GW2011_GWA2_40_23]
MPEKFKGDLPPEERIVDQGYHQIESDISLPTDPELLLKVITKEQTANIAKELGHERLQSLVAVSHGGEKVDYEAAARQEAKDLKEVRTAIAKVTGISKPWIIGFASDFAKCLLTLGELPESPKE